MILGQDATLTEDRMKAIVNGELANDLGNLLSRVAKLVNSSIFDGKIPNRYDFENSRVTPLSETETIPSISNNDWLMLIGSCNEQIRTF